MSDFLAIFDVDGTLADSQHIIHDTMAKAFASVDRLAPERQTVARMVGLSLPRMVEALLPDANEAIWDLVTAEYRLNFAAAMESGGEAPLYDGAEACLDRLEAAGISLGIATGKSKRGLDRLISDRGWEGRFVTLQCADFHPSKPHPSMLRRALLEAALPDEAAVMVGDTSFDIEMARAAGLPALGVAWGYHTPEVLERAGADVVVPDFDKLADDIEARAAAYRENT